MVRLSYHPRRTTMGEFKQTVREALCQAIAATLQRGGRQVPQFKDADRPVKDYDGLDSQCGLEVTVELEEALGVNDLGNNIFIKGTGRAARARCLSEVVANILAKMKARKGRTS
jgi:acyl carrier protein